MGSGAVAVTSTGPQCQPDSAAFEVRQKTGTDSKWCFGTTLLSESTGSLNTISVLGINKNSSALLLLIINVLCETQQKGIASLWLCQGKKVELCVGMQLCLIRFYNYFDTILVKHVGSSSSWFNTLIVLSWRIKNLPDIHSITIFYCCTLIIYKYAYSNCMLCFYLVLLK